MDRYIEAIRTAADDAHTPIDLKRVLDFIMELASADYKAGALAVTEYGTICTEYSETLKTANVVNYM